MAAILSLLNSWKLIATVASALALCALTWYITHGLDQRAYTALALTQANAVIAQQKADAAALESFRKQASAAGAAAQKTFAVDAADAKASQAGLAVVLAARPTSGKHNALTPSFTDCAGVVVPVSVRQHLAN